MRGSEMMGEYKHNEVDKMTCDRDWATFQREMTTTFHTSEVDKMRDGVLVCKSRRVVEYIFRDSFEEGEKYFDTLSDARVFFCSLEDLTICRKLMDTWVMDGCEYLTVAEQ